VLLGTPVGEHHSLPVAMLGDLLRGAGWDVSDLGADLPVESFVRATLDTPDLVAVGVSVTSPDNLPAAAEVLAALRAAVSEAILVVGGAAVTGVAHALELGAQGWAASAREFDELLVQRGGAGSRVR
jgi:methanogenic corrinoid protein MtbC1